MSHHLISISNADRVDACPPSVFLPGRVLSTGDSAERGNVIHQFVDHVVSGIRTKALALGQIADDEWRVTCEKLDLAALVGDLTDVKTEMAYAMNTATAEVRFIGRRIGRNYPALGAEWIPGTNDIEGWIRPGVRCVRDIKTGRKLGAVKDKWQPRFHAFAQWATHPDCDEVVAGFAYVDESGEVEIDEVPFDVVDDLATIPNELEAVLARLGTERDIFDKVKSFTVRDGDHCRYCPSFLSCPAQVGIVRNLLVDVEGVDLMLAAFQSLTPAQLGTAWAKWKQMVPLFERVEKTIKAAVREQIANGVVVETPEGAVIREIPKSRAGTDGERALALLHDYGATQEDIASCMRETRFTELRTIKPKAEKKTKLKGAA